MPHIGGITCARWRSASRSRMEGLDKAAQIRISAPTEGGFSDGSFTGRFRALAVSEADAFNLLTSEGTVDYLRSILIGWDGVVGEDGEAVSFNDAARDELLDIPFVRVAVLNAYNAAMMGARRGN